jgi:hypothetical protein
LGARECAQHGYTPLHWAAKKGHANCVALLAERGANVEATDEVRCAVPVATAAAALHRHGGGVCAILKARTLRERCDAAAVCP